MKELAKSKVQFDVNEHIYTNEQGKRLQGVTGVLKKYLFSDMYANVPDFVLNKAAERGSNVHAEIEAIISGFEPTALSQEAENYKMLGINAIESEYLISDNDNIASSIDIVDKDYNLYDIKTTSVLQREYLRWQLSIYAYLFELQNPTLKVGKLFAIHLRDDKCEVIEIERIADEHIVALINAVANNDESFENPIQKTIPAEMEQQIQVIADLELYIAECEAGLKIYKERQDTIKQALLKAMQDNNIQKWETDNISVTRKAEYTRKSVDSKKLQAEYPQAYENCLKETTVKESILFKMK